MLFSDASGTGVWAVSCSATRIQEDEVRKPEDVVLVTVREGNQEGMVLVAVAVQESRGVQGQEDRVV